MYARLKNQATKMNKICQESMFIRYLTISKTKEVVRLKDDIQKENQAGNMVEMTATFQQRETKANRTRKGQPVQDVVIIILENHAQQEQSNAITVRKLAILRSNVG